MLDGLSLVCPGCFEPLIVLGATWSCTACGRAGQPLGPVAALYPEPDAELAAIEVGATRYLKQSMETAERATRELDGGVLDVSRGRLEALGEGLRRHVAGLGQRWQAAGITLRGDGGSTRHDPNRVASQTLRDWAWPGAEGWEDENRQALTQVRCHIDGAIGRLLVIGAGAGRLAYDLHGDAERTVALDVSPFALLVGASIWGGATVEMWEFPPVPRSRPAHCWKASAPVATEGIVAMAADGLDPPFAGGSFDTVVTPWFIDQIPRDLPRFLQVLRYLLRPGGRWLNLGPLIYPADSPMSVRHDLREVIALAEAAGFDVDTPTSSRIHYLCSPVSTQGRVEVVHAFAARRDEVPRVDRPRPPWLRRTDLPVPRFGAKPDHPVKRVVAEAIDGRRTVRDIVEHLVRTRGMPAQDAAVGVQMTIVDLYDRR